MAFREALEEWAPDQEPKEQDAELDVPVREPQAPINAPQSSPMAAFATVTRPVTLREMADLRPRSTAYRAVCTNCGQAGHSKPRCPTVQCWSCLRYGHIQYNCPRNEEWRREMLRYRKQRDAGVPEEELDRPHHKRVSRASQLDRAHRVLTNEFLNDVELPADVFPRRRSREGGASHHRDDVKSEDREGPSCSRKSPPRRHRSPCYFYAKGRCRNGDRCPFQHGPKASTGSLCPHHARGYCQNGDGCPWRHSLDDSIDRGMATRDHSRSRPRHSPPPMRHGRGRSGSPIRRRDGLSPDAGRHSTQLPRYRRHEDDDNSSDAHRALRRAVHGTSHSPKHRVYRVRKRSRSPSGGRRTVSPIQGRERRSSDARHSSPLLPPHHRAGHMEADTDEDLGRRRRPLTPSSDEEGTRMNRHRSSSPRSPPGLPLVQQRQPVVDNINIAQQATSSTSNSGASHFPNAKRILDELQGAFRLLADAAEMEVTDVKADAAGLQLEDVTDFTDQVTELAEAVLCCRTVHAAHPVLQRKVDFLQRVHEVMLILRDDIVELYRCGAEASVLEELCLRFTRVQAEQQRMYKVLHSLNAVLVRRSGDTPDAPLILD